MPAKTTPRRPPKEPLGEVLRATALAYLERFPASAARTRQVLERRIRRYCSLVPEADPATYVEAIPPLIDSLRAGGYIDDSAYAKGLRASLARKGVPARVAAQKMRTKGIAPDLVDATFAQDIAQEGPQEHLCALRFARRKKLGPFAAHGREKPFEKAMAAFARAGFDYETAARIMKMDPDLAAQDLAQDPL